MQTTANATVSKALPARLPKGFELGDFIVEGWVRDGGMAAIYRARRRDGTRVAIKLQLPSTVHLPEICARFEREADALRRVGASPNVVELYESDLLDDGRRYFVLEWIEGEDLEEFLDLLRNQDERISIARACRIGAEIARGLAQIHDHDLVHRDLKPANVMVGRAEGEGEADVVKLVDFGIVADLRDDRPLGGSSGTEEVMGTSAYMAPEQAAGRPPKPSLDLFPLGVVLYEALTGTCVPPDGWTPESLPAIESLRRGVSADLADLVRSCMSSQPGSRPDSASMVADMLVALASEVKMPAEPPGERPVRRGKTEVTPRSKVAPLAAMNDAAVASAEPSRPDSGSEPATSEATAKPPTTAGGTELMLVPGAPATSAAVTAASERPPSGEILSGVAPPPPGSGAFPVASVHPGSGAFPVASVHPGSGAFPVASAHPGSGAFPVASAHPGSGAFPVVPPPSATLSRTGRTELMTHEEVIARSGAIPVSRLNTEVVSPVPRARGRGGRKRRWWLLAPVIVVIAGGATLGAMLGERSNGDGAPTMAVIAGDGENDGRVAEVERDEAPAVPSIPSVAESDEAPVDEPTPPDDESIPTEPTPAPVVEPEEMDEDETEDEPEDVLEPEPEPEPEPKRDRQRQRRNQPSPAQCVEVRSEAQAAKRSRAWADVLQATAKRACWKGKDGLERRRLRVEAFAEKGDYNRCVEEGGRSKDGEIKRRVMLCRSRLGE